MCRPIFPDTRYPAHFVVYDHPRDYPLEYVCRRYVSYPGHVEPDLHLSFRSTSLNRIEQQLAAMGLTRSEPNDLDDLSIVSVWT